MIYNPNMDILAPILKLASLTLLLDFCLAQYTPISRWGQATVVVGTDLYVHGGSTDPTNSFPYASAPPVNDLLHLSLASPFNPSSPPWQLVSSSANPQGPSLVWHTLSAFRSNRALLFGGKFGANSATVLPSANDSAWLLSTDNPTVPVWITESPSWASEPIRRIRHTTSTSRGRVFLIGGEKADGSSLGFDTHYVFDINGPSFSPLPSEKSPPDISGHASVVLPDGRLLVLGGYALSQRILSPLTTLWILDTTHTPLKWSSILATGSTIPPSRRGFAAAALSDGRVIVHGGCDANYQTSYNDGWILDTTQNPMIWTSVPDLIRLGARRDHFAIALGNSVIFGFGYGSNAAAPVELQIYDGASGQWAPSYVPPPNFTPTDSFGGPSRTTTSTASVHSSPTSTTSTPNNGGGTSSSSAKSSGTAIAVGVTLAVLALLLVSFIYFCLKRRSRQIARSHWRHNPESSSFGDAVLIMNDARENRSKRGWFSGLGILESNAGRRARHERERKDILADEDTRHFSYYEVDAGVGSTWSLRSMGAMIGGAMGIRSREPSTRSRREKSDPFSDNASLIIEQGSNPPGAGPRSRPQERRQQSYSSFLSSDPFSDPISEVVRERSDPDLPTSDVYEYATMRSTNVHPYPTPLPQQRITSLMVDTHTMPAVREQSESIRTLSPDRPLSPFSGPSSPTSLTTLSDKGAFPLTAGVNPPPTMPIRRSDSWWSRFLRTSLIDRRPSSSSSGRYYIDFRDPNPPPRLGAIAEASTSMAESLMFDQIAGRSRYESQVSRGKSTSSLRTTGTTDTAAIEQLGEMVVVQREEIPSHRGTGSTVGRESVIESDPAEQADRTLLAYYEPFVLSPPNEYNWSSLQDEAETTSPWRSTGFVTTRVEAYERKLSLEQDLAGVPPDPVNINQLEERTRKRGHSVNYGLAPRPSLFIANPDTAHGNSQSLSS